MQKRRRMCKNSILDSVNTANFEKHTLNLPYLGQPSIFSHNLYSFIHPLIRILKKDGNYIIPSLSNHNVEATKGVI